MTSTPTPLLRSITDSPAPHATAPDVPAPEVSVVVVAYGTGPMLIESITSLCAATDAATEVVVVSNPHPVHGQRSASELHLFTSGITVVEPDRNVGFGGGCELGALVARGDILAFVNPDVIVADGWLRPLLDVIAASPVPTIAAPILLDPDGGIQEVGQRIDRAAHTTPVLEVPNTDVVEVDYSSAACWVVRRDDHERVGGFDPAYHPAYFEDVDLAIRVRRVGGRCLVVTAARVVHHRGEGSPERAEPAESQRDVLVRRWPQLRWRSGT